MADPTPGQVWRVKGFEFRVDFVKEGQVYFVRWDEAELAKHPDTLGIAKRTPIEDWNRQMKEAGATVSSDGAKSGAGDKL